MLSIPESIKTLFKTDGTRKNFRAHFPNGELPDITNENIVRESVHFTESIASQNTFRFGLAEASVIEFETVGVANMYGYTIECSYEIDTSSLSATDITAIQSDPGNGTLVLAAVSDIGYGFYRVPLGVFRVESCPRNHGAMTHRKVTGYTQGLTDNGIMSPYEKWKQTAWTILPTMSYQSVEALIDANLGWWNPDIVSQNYTKTEKTIGSPLTNITLVSKSIEVDEGTISIYGAFRSGYAEPISRQAGMLDLWAVELNDFDNSTAIAWVKSAMDSLGIGAYTDAVLDELATTLFVTTGNPIPGRSGSPFIIYETAPIMYPMDGANLQIYGAVTARVTLAFTPTGGQRASTTDDFTLSASGTPFRMYRLRKNDQSGHPVVFQPSASLYNTTREMYEYLYEDAYSFIALFRGWSELAAAFATENRGKGLEVIVLSPSSPASISPGDYEEVWWDEYDVDPIGTVMVSYRNGEEGEATANVTLGAGASLYDMTDNEVLKNLSDADLDSVTELLSGDFAANATSVGFTPIDMTMQGWPWLEAGDALQITAEDGTVVNTYALRIEMDGVQHLTSTITAEGGEIIGEV